MSFRSRKYRTRSVLEFCVRMMIRFLLNEKKKKQITIMRLTLSTAQPIDSVNHASSRRVFESHISDERKAFPRRRSSRRISARGVPKPAKTYLQFSFVANYIYTGGGPSMRDCGGRDNCNYTH